jgi:UDP-N-acetylmuramoylalanine--D-glutamate ligase
MNYHGKHILVIGLGRSGLAATRLLQKVNAVVTVVDTSKDASLQERAEALRAEGITVFLGEEAFNLFGNSISSANHCVAPVLSSSISVCYECAILSPGIELTSPVVQQVVAQAIPIIGELELAYDFCQCPIVAITGTNGKTTTTELTVAALQGGGLKTIACGNIGLPFSEAVLESSSLDVIVIEVSSFQLETTDRFHAHIAVWLNLSPNHLDRYASMAEYRQAKLRIFRNQQESDVVIIPKNFNTEGLPQFRAKQLTFSSQDSNADFFFDGESILYKGESILRMSQTQLRGAHNAQNMMAALAVGVALGVAPLKMIEALSQYHSLPHRCEVVAEQEGVLWINDSKSTTLDAMEQALQSIPQKNRIFLIAGGKNKGSSFSPILPLIQQQVKVAILLGEMKGSISEAWSGVVCYQVDSMEEAVQAAAAQVEPGDVVLLSPGTSSYDMFKNYEERGDRFKTAVRQLLSFH